MTKDTTKTLDEIIDNVNIQNSSPQSQEVQIRSEVESILEKQFDNSLTQEDYQRFQILASQNPQLVEKTQRDFMQREDVQEKIRKIQEQEQQRIEQLRSQIDTLRLGSSQLSESGAYSKIRADQVESQLLNSGGKRILHFTDTEVEADQLEGRLAKLLHDEGVLGYVQENGRLPENTVLVHTGDIGPDLFNQMKYRTQAFLADTVIKEGELTGEDAQEFKQLYHEMMDQAGVTEEMLIRGIKTQEDQQALQQFIQLLYGFTDPMFKTSDDIKEFRKKRDKLHSHLEKAIINHSKRNMGEIKEVFDKYGLNDENFVIISGNHDVPHVVQDTFGNSYLSEGETREVGGIKFNRPLGSATGSVYGPLLARDIMGSNELIEQIPQMRYNSEPFRELKQYVQQELGFDHLNDSQIDDLIKFSVRKSQFGFPSGELKHVNDRIEEDVKAQIQQRLQRIPQTLDNNAHVYLGHGDVTHPQHAGLEETYLRQLLDGKGDDGKFYLGGHQHGETTNQTNRMTYINPGASRDSYAHGVVYVNSDNSLHSLKST
ncbi:MAG: hypothetical protein LAT82_01750 [Nanoarchaeota archaeon]|nr:hypothetical protein [Nanoarchaeota archaeon]